MSGVRALYWNVFFKSLANGLIGIFVPIYIYVLVIGDGGTWLEGVRWVMVYEVILRVVMAGLAIKVAQAIEKLGFRKSIALGTTLEVMLFLVLIVVEKNFFVIIPAAMLAGLAYLWYWLARMSLLATDGESDKFGKELGGITLLTDGPAVLAPFVGGVIVAQFGFEILFLVGIMILLFSIVPMFFMMGHHHGDGVGWENFWRFVRKKKNKVFVAGFAGRAIEDVVIGIFWGLFIFIAVKGFESFGLILSLASGVSLLATFLVGLLFDRLHNRKDWSDEIVFGVGTLALAVYRMVMLLGKTLWGLFWLDVGHRLIGVFHWLPESGYEFLAAKGSKPLEFFAYRETIYSMARIMVMLLGIWVIGTPLSWWGLFFMAGVGSMMTLGMTVVSNK